MRSGDNLAKEKKIDFKRKAHRVIIPLYIPKEEGYYQESFKSFKYCLLSLLKTSSTELKISVVSNGSCGSVEEKLQTLYNEKLIDDLVLVKENIGKVNAILKVLRTTEERLVTITDADVLFLDRWEDAVFDVFTAFPKAAAVSPVPLFGNQKTKTLNIWWDYFFSSKFRFENVIDPDAMTKFAKSIGWPWLDKKYKDVILTIESDNGTKAVVGCNHMAVTYKTEVFKAMPDKNSIYALGGDSEKLYLDEPTIKCDGYRLATQENYAYHIGNTIEPWLSEIYENLTEVKRKNNFDLKFKKLKPNKIRYFITQKVFSKLFLSRCLLKLFYRWKGLEVNKLNYFFDN
ncbi:glycosyltransferase family A protein [Hyunsoonleella pacifica]|uniref:Glycosyltransferase family 2 protein n=1 Tax=Hyunsoonleella pacifica TaxID=1080224 RepID=A0A4Q9FS68_9FLAO|nr:glycosyltransferase family A protein [Hyunsoonleella pacifica]TBN18510.1 glycosyltransferase family 2 protein [Hyunsoonleella pacifica]GGD02407.1 hypothetical protein GCM10011368_00270 [Hyunsoonleella pacifica]